MLNEDFQKQIALIDLALRTEQGEMAFRKYLGPFVEAEVRKLLKRQGVEAEESAQLLDAGWKYLRPAMENYRNHADLMLRGKTPVYEFRKYFAWYVRQGVVDYVKEKS